MIEPEVLHLPGMVMVGAAERHAGKTELASRLVRHLAARHRVVGVKVSVDEDDRAPVVLQEEPAPSAGDPAKDTHRLLLAGAHPVLWLRCGELHLDQAARSLSRALPRQAVVVCESNRLRLVVRPGVFLVVRRAGSRRVKPSCARVLSLADAVVLSDGRSFSLRPEELSVRRGRVVLDRVSGP